MREQGTLVVPRLWAEKGVGTAKLNKHEKPAVLHPRKRRNHPGPDPAQGGGGGKTKKKG